tara:strand:- start:1681 stop:3429 length:1749 start_codon:yes stop_codon:yes gene_type:complete
MLNNLKFRWAIIFSVIAFSIYFILPSIKFYLFNNQDNQQTIKLGLDLKGGLNIVLELDEYVFMQRLAKPRLSKKSHLEYKNILNSAKVNSQNNQTFIIDEIENLANDKNIKLNKFFANLSRSSNNQEIIQEIKNQKEYAMSNILDVMRNRIADHDQYGLGEPSIQQLGSNRLVVELAGITDILRAKDYIKKTADFELSLVKKQAEYFDIVDKINKAIINKNISFPSLDSLMVPDRSTEGYLVEEKHVDKLISFFNSDSINQLIKSNNKIVWENDILIFQGDNINQQHQYRRTYLVSSNSAISSGMIQTPKAVISDAGTDNAGQWVVNLDMTKEGRKKWAKFTGKNINRQVAIILDGYVFMAPFVRDKISTGSTQISGFSSMQEAKDIASVLKAGELPAPINIIQTNYIGPSLGQDSINAGSFAMVLGVILVLLFMILYYKTFGVIANIALIVNIIVVFAVLYTMGAVLTLPGIAGLLLTVGIAVDANVIIFERIKEELKLNSNLFIAIKNGYNKAFITILDANITTLLTAFVLSFLGSGPIKGFATTLSVGIICSMFTAIFLTRTIFLSIINYSLFKKIIKP